MRYARIDLNTGLFIEDVILMPSDEVTEDLIEEPVPDGFNLPKWDGEKWIEGKTVLSIPLEQEMAELKNALEATDYQIIKCYEYQLVGLEMPYDITELHTHRQAIRDRINELEALS